MRTRKRFLWVAFIAVLAFLLNTTCFASGNTISLSSSNGQAGDTVVLTLTFDSEVDVGCLGVFIEYDKNTFSFVEASEINGATFDELGFTQSNQVNYAFDEAAAPGIYIATLTFVINSNANNGVYNFTLTVDSDSCADICDADWVGQGASVSNGTVTIGGGSTTDLEVGEGKDIVSYAGSANISGSVDNGTATINVDCSKACVVAYTTDNGQTYTRVNASQNATSGYDFSVPNYSDTMKFVVAVKGDLNGDGDTDGTDAYQIDRYDAGLRTLTALQALVCDINGDGDTDGTDSYQIERLDAGLRTFNWDI